VQPAQIGINVVGHIRSASGLGVSARNFIRALRERGVPVAVLDVDYGLTRGPVELPSDVTVVDSVEALPHAINIVCVAIQLLPKLLLKQHPELLHARFFNVGLVFWELPSLPRVWGQALRLFDALATCSSFVRRTLEAALPNVPTVHCEQPLYLPAVAPADRAALRLDASAFVFGASFDLGGDVTRKNPAAIVRAFQAAFPDDGRVQLVLKANGDLTRVSHPDVDYIAGVLAHDPRIRLVAETLPYERVIALHAACDAYVSLHRAEGLGLGLLEAMALGLATIGTGYSGNTHFMTPMNSWSVRYRLVSTANCAWQYSRAYSGAGAYWAHPDETHAAAIFREVVDNPAARDARIAVGVRDARERQQAARRVDFVDELALLSTASRRQPATSRRRTRRLLVAELFHPVHMRLHLRRLFQ